MYATNRPLFLCERLVDLGDGFAPPGGCKFFAAKESLEEAAAVAQLLAFHDLETGDGSIENGEAAHGMRIDLFCRFVSSDV